MRDLRERVARAICEAFTEDPEMVDDFVDTGNLYPRKLWQSYLPFADAAIAICMKEAARCAEAFPARTHGALATAPYAAAEQAADEIAAAIRAMIRASD